MKLKTLFEKSIVDVTADDIVRFKKIHQRSDIKSSDINPENVELVKRIIQRNIVGGKIKIYRAIELEPYSELSTAINRRLGIYWTYDITSAKAYRSTHRGYGEEYIIEATINEKYVDWEATIALNTIDTRGTYENEIRLFKNTPIDIDKIYLNVNGKLIDEDVSKLTGRFVA